MDVYPNNKTKIRRNKFTKTEDKLLNEYVQKYGEKNWKHINEFFPNRTTRQCRERWKYFLSPSTAKNKKKWTVCEDVLLLNKYSKYGSSWSKINTFFKGRTDVSLKNRFHYLKRNHMINSSVENSANSEYSNFEEEDNHEDAASKGKNDTDTSLNIENIIKNFNTDFNDDVTLPNDSAIMKDVKCECEKTNETENIQIKGNPKINIELPCPVSILCLKDLGPYQK